MPDITGGLISAGASILGSVIQGDAAESAAETQSDASAAGIAEQRRQFERVRELLQPYVSAGNVALGQQQNVLGQLANYGDTGLNNVLNSPLYSGLLRQGETAILQNASATGGLRGGNIQNALANYRTNLAANLEQQQYNRLQNQFTNAGALSQLGQASAAGVGSAGQNVANNIGNLLAQQGAAVAGGDLAQGAILSRGIGNLAGLYSSQPTVTSPISSGNLAFTPPDYSLVSGSGGGLAGGGLGLSTGGGLGLSIGGLR